MRMIPYSAGSQVSHIVFPLPNACLGLLKEEYSITRGSAVMVCPKTYNLLNFSDNKAKKALKGVSHRNNTIKHNHLLKAVYEGTTTKTVENVFRIKKAAVKTQRIERSAINPIFTKLRVSDDRVTITPLFTLDQNGDKKFV